MGRRGAGAGTAVFRAVVRGYSFGYPIQKYHSIMQLQGDTILVILCEHPTGHLGPQRRDPAGRGEAGQL